MDDASLDDFVDAEAESADQSDSPTDVDSDTAATAGSESDKETPQDTDSETTAAEESAVSGPPAEVEPAAVTSHWTPSGSFCEDCGDETSRLWTDEAGTVCRSCKDW